MKKSVGRNFGLKVVFIFFGFFFLFSFISASCSDNQMMFRLYQNTNSHVALWDQVNYTIPLCYNDFFGYNYSGENSHNCSQTNSNVLFWISSSFNSHVSNSSSDVYTVPICFGNLNCSVVFGDCPNGAQAVVKLYNYTNTHVSNLSDSNYNYTLCCRSSFSSLAWLDMKGNSITVADVEDDVIIFGGNVSAQITYSILNASNVEVYTSSSSKGFGYWKADKEGNYSFKITQNGGLLGISSENLVVSGSNNSAPTLAQITSPTNWYRIKIGSLLPLNQISMDNDDLLNIFWWLGNGSYYFVENYSYFEKNSSDFSLGNKEVNYTTSGVYLIELKVQEKDRSLMLVNQTFVAVFKEGVNVIPVVSSPLKGNSIESDVVFFNASETYVANCSSCSGSCSGTRANGFYTDDGLLNCTYLHAPRSNLQSDLSGYKLNFKWTLDNGRVISGDWSEENYWKVIEFIYRFALPGEHLAKLEVSYASL